MNNYKHFRETQRAAVVWVWSFLCGFCLMIRCSRSDAMWCLNPKVIVQVVRLCEVLTVDASPVVDTVQRSSSRERDELLWLEPGDKHTHRTKRSKYQLVLYFEICTIDTSVRNRPLLWNHNLWALQINSGGEEVCLCSRIWWFSVVPKKELFPEKVVRTKVAIMHLSFLCRQSSNRNQRTDGGVEFEGWGCLSYSYYEL